MTYGLLQYRTEGNQLVTRPESRDRDLFISAKKIGSRLLPRRNLLEMVMFMTIVSSVRQNP